MSTWNLLALGSQLQQPGTGQPTPASWTSSCDEDVEWRQPGLRVPDTGLLGQHLGIQTLSERWTDSSTSRHHSERRRGPRKPAQRRLELSAIELQCVAEETWDPGGSLMTAGVREARAPQELHVWPEGGSRGQTGAGHPVAGPSGFSPMPRATG